VYGRWGNLTLIICSKWELCGLQSDRTHMMRLTDLSLDKFWVSLKEYPALRRKAINILLQFLTSYICEQTFSCLTSIKIKDRNRLISAGDDLHVCFLKFDPELSICATKNKHKFHIKEVNLILYFSLKNNTVLDDIFVHIVLSYIFSNLTIQQCQ
jgi:hypothetical protein